MRCQFTNEIVKTRWCHLSQKMTLKHGKVTINLCFFLNFALKKSSCCLLFHSSKLQLQSSFGVDSKKMLPLYHTEAVFPVLIYGQFPDHFESKDFFSLFWAGLIKIRSVFF